MKDLEVTSKNRNSSGSCMLHNNTGSYRKIIEIRIKDIEIRLCTQHAEIFMKKIKHALDYGRIW